MPLNEETRRTGMCGRASNVSLGSDTFDLAHTDLIFNQAARIARRFVVSDALARTIAEHAFSNGGSA
ncbi:hypothetical protein [Aureimonas flava]|uniref:hypothetical protein n=1 Tax=Aureimonas flava TaxID=2320271 RepID=UPI0010A97ACB|nr:hypothetical protein [Aureimonas flava]